MDFEDAVDWAEPSNMGNEEYVALIDKRLKELEQGQVPERIDTEFVYLALRELFSEKESRIPVYVEPAIHELARKLTGLWYDGMRTAVYFRLSELPPKVSAAVAAGVCCLLGPANAQAFYLGIKTSAAGVKKTNEHDHL